MTVELDTITPDEDHALHPEDEFMLALLAGQTIRSAAERAGISYATARRRVDDDAFRRRLIELRHDMVDRIVGARLSASIAATGFLLRMMHDENAAPWHRLNAARALASNPLGLELQLRELRGF